MRISDWSSDVCSSDLPLCLAQRIGANEHAAVGFGAHRSEQLGDLVPGGRVAEHRQAKGRLGDEDIARDDFEGRAGRVGAALIVAGDDDPLAPIFHQYLRAAEDMARSDEHTSELQSLMRISYAVFCLKKK